VKLAVVALALVAVTLVSGVLTIGQWVLEVMHTLARLGA
jgi:Flp pilus assembly pilin Flp